MLPFRIKSGSVDKAGIEYLPYLVGMQPQTMLAIFGVYIATNNFLEEHPNTGVEEFVITEITGGGHSVASLHYVGFAVDVRYKDTSSAGVLIGIWKEVLGNDYDVVYHAGSHFHVEFQPKTGARRY